MPRLGKQTNFTGAVTAVVVVRGDVRRVTSWVEKGTVPAYVVDLEGSWCAVVPAGDGHAAPPYHEPATVMAARPTPMTMRPSLAFFPEGEHAVVVVQARRWRSLPRWFVVRQDVGPVRAQVPQASAVDLLTAGEESNREAFDRVLAQSHVAPVDMLRGLMAALGVPAGHLLDLSKRAEIEALLVEPAAKAVKRFDKTVGEERHEQQEMQGWVE